MAGKRFAANLGLPLHLAIVERFTPGRLFEDQLEGPSSPLYWALLGLFAVLLLASLYVYLQADRRFAVHRLHRRLARRFPGLCALFSGMGLAATTFSLLAVPFLSKRLWLAIALLGLLGTAGYGAFYFKRRYPVARANFLEYDRRQRYLPRPKSPPRKRRAARRR